MSQVSQHDDVDDPPPLYQSDAAGVAAGNALIKEVGTTGCILGASAGCIPGVVVDMGFEYLVRIAIRKILLCPPAVQDRLKLKYGRHTPNSENMSTTRSGSDAIVDHKLAVITACRLMTGVQALVGDFGSFSIVKTVAAEVDEWKRSKAICGRPRRPSHTFRVLAKACL